MLRTIVRTVFAAVLVGAGALGADEARSARADADNSGIALVTADPEVAIGIPLRYGWKKGEHYLYSVRIEVKMDSGARVLTGMNNYGVPAADDKSFLLRQRNNLVAKTDNDEGKTTQIVLQSGLSAAARTNEIRIDPFGQVLKSSGESQLPFVLGNMSMLALFPLSPEGKASWEVKSTCVIQESTPQKAPISKLKKKLPPPPPKTTDYPAQETTVFTIEKQTGDLVIINKKYVLKTRHEVDGKPYLEFEGEGPITFDKKAGIPRAMEFKGVLRSASRNSDLPITVSYKLLEGEEREKALKLPQPPEPKAAGEKPKGTDASKNADDPALTGAGKGLEWTDDVAKMKIPESPAAGKILGHDFKVEATKLEPSGALTLREGKGFFPDTAIIIFLKPGAAIEGKTYEIRKDTPALERPPIHLKRVPPGQKLPAGPAFVLDYAMKLEFGKIKDGSVPGRIYVCLPDEGRSVVAGTFVLKLQ
jgi:hypothetical protein